MHSRDLEKPTAQAPTNYKCNITTVITQLATTAHSHLPLPTTARLPPRVQASVQDTEVMVLLSNPRQDILLDRGLAARHPMQAFQWPREACQLTYSRMATHPQQHGPAQLVPSRVAPLGS